MSTAKSIFSLGALSLAFVLAACSDDDGDPAVCGNGQVEGDEVCDQTNLNGQSCTTIPGGYTGGDLSCSNTCTFVTSQCTTGQEDCGNDELEAGEDCDGSDLGTATCQTAGDFTGGTLGCTSTCTFDTSQCIGGTDCGNGTVDANEDCDGSSLDGETCVTIGGGYVGGTLACAGNCSFDVTGCLDPSEAIQQVIENMDQSGLTLPIAGAYVTYLTPGIGSVTNDPAGFTVQAAQGGPAIFVAVDPATLTPVPVVGDEVSFTVTQTALTNGQPRVVALTDFARVSQGFDVGTLAQDVTTAADLVTALDSRTSELITATVTITGAFDFAGTGFMSAEVTTDAITTGTLPVLRIPGPLRQSLGLHTGCILTVTETPLWRFLTEAQIGVWRASDITAAVCDAPQVLSAVATSPTTVVVVFNRDIDPTTVIAGGSQFTITDGMNPLAVSAAASTGDNQVTLTTATQTGGVTYTVTVAGTVEDIFGTGVDQAADTADFIGFETFGAQLYLWEVDSADAGQDDMEFVEIWNNTGSAVDFSTQKYFLLHLLGQNINDTVGYQIQLTGTLASNGLHLVGNAGVAGVQQVIGNGVLENGADGVLLVRCDACTGTALQEFPNGLDVTTSDTFTTSSAGGGSGSTATKIDALAYDSSDLDDVGLMDKLGVSIQWNEDGNGNGDTESLHRDVNVPSLWTLGAPTPGTL